MYAYWFIVDHIEYSVYSIKGYLFVLFLFSGLMQTFSKYELFEIQALYIFILKVIGL